MIFSTTAYRINLMPKTLVLARWKQRPWSKHREVLTKVMKYPREPTATCHGWAVRMQPSYGHYWHALQLIHLRAQNSKLSRLILFMQSQVLFPTICILFYQNWCRCFNDLAFIAKNSVVHILDYCLARTADLRSHGHDLHLNVSLKTRVKFIDIPILPPRL